MRNELSDCAGSSEDANRVDNPDFWQPFKENSDRSYRKYLETGDVDYLRPHNLVDGGTQLIASLRLISQSYFSSLQSGTALDVGCGGGYTTETMRLAGYDSIGLDSSEAACQVASIRFPVANFIFADGLHPSELFDGSTFDLILAREFHPFYAVRDDDLQSRVVSEYVELLKPGGMLAIVQAGKGRKHIHFRTIAKLAASRGCRVVMPINHAVLRRIATRKPAKLLLRFRWQFRLISVIGKVASRIRGGMSDDIFIIYRPESD